MGTPAKSRWRPLADFLLGIGLAAAGAVMVWHFYPGFWKEPAAAAVDEAMERRDALRRQALAQQALAEPAPPAGPVATGGKCDFEPLIPPGSAADGHARAEHPFPGGPRAKAKVFVRAANQAAARQRPRDAEVALIAACRQNELASTRPTVPLARVLAQLGERYALAATGDHPLEVREGLLARARLVLASSADVYAAALGPNASRSRQARQRVLDLEQDTLVAADVPVPPKPARADAMVEARRAPVRKAAPPAPPAPPRKAPQEAPEPARSPVPVESDPELRQLASDLARLRAQAEAVSDDPAGFRQRTQQAQAQREQCRDAACLQAWHARRKRELLAEF